MTSHKAKETWQNLKNNFVEEFANYTWLGMNWNEPVWTGMNRYELELTGMNSNLMKLIWKTNHDLTYQLWKKI